MTEIGGIRYLTIPECLERLPFIMSERAFRRVVRTSGCGIEHRRQLILTEADLNAVLDAPRTRERA